MVTAPASSLAEKAIMAVVVMADASISDASIVDASMAVTIVYE